MSAWKFVLCTPLLVLTLSVLASAQVAKGTSSPEIISDPAPNARLEQELKQAVDRSLARFVRELRRDLHQAIERATRSPEPDLDSLLKDLAGIAPETGKQPSPSSTKDPKIQELERQIRELEASLGISPGSDKPAIQKFTVTWKDLGVMLKETPPESVGVRELEVARVRSGSPAQKAGLKVGDSIAFVDSLAVTEDLNTAPGRSLLVMLGGASRRAINIQIPSRQTLIAQREIEAMWERAKKKVIGEQAKRIIGS